MDLITVMAIHYKTTYTYKYYMLIITTIEYKFRFFMNMISVASSVYASVSIYLCYLMALCLNN